MKKSKTGNPTPKFVAKKLGVKAYLKKYVSKKSVGENIAWNFVRQKVRWKKIIRKYSDCSKS